MPLGPFKPLCFWSRLCLSHSASSLVKVTASLVMREPGQDDGGNSATASLPGAEAQVRA